MKNGNIVIIMTQRIDLLQIKKVKRLITFKIKLKD